MLTNRDKELSVIVPVTPPKKNLKKFSHLGSGYTSKVYVGKWGDMVVAIKEQKQSDSAKKYFENEKDIMKIISQITIPNSNIVKCWIQDDIIDALILEFLPNGDLCDYLAKNNNLNLQNKHQISFGTANGLAYLHENNIIHCDIKLENIMLDKDMQPKIIDFGFAIAIDKDTKKPIKGSKLGSEVRGTPNFLAPELILAMLSLTECEYTEKTDVYALAITLYELYTASAAYNESNYNELCIQILAQHQRPQLNNIPVNIAGVLTLGWMHDSKSRSRANEMAKQFETIIASQIENKL